MFKTAVRLMKLVTEIDTQTTLAVLAKDVYEDLDPGSPGDPFQELPYDDWVTLLVHKLGWEFGKDYVVCNEGNMFIKPNQADKVVSVAPSLVADAFLTHLQILETTCTAGYNLAHLEWPTTG